MTDTTEDKGPKPLTPFANLRDRFKELAAEHGLKLVDAQILFDDGGTLRVALQQLPEAADPEAAEFDAKFAELIAGFNEETEAERAEAKADTDEVRELRRRMQGGKGIL